MIYHFILNPKSGRTKGLVNLESQIKKACQSRQLNYHIYYTTQPGDATEYVRSMISISSDRQRFIAIGGDGTINEIVNSAPGNMNVDFGVIPGGSGNDFVRNFANKKLFYDIEAQVDGTTISLDLIKCNDYYCVNMVNIGFDCAVCKTANDLKKRKVVPPGLAYIVGVIIELCRKFGTTMKFLFDDGKVYDEEWTLTCIANGKYCGGGFKSAPRAVLNDGKMDLVMIKKVSRATFLSLVSFYKNGTYPKISRAMKVIETRQVSHFRMEFEKPIPICIDGEIKSSDKIDFRLVPNAFNFVVPVGSYLIDRNKRKRKKSKAKKAK